MKRIRTIFSLSLGGFVIVFALMWMTLSLSVSQLAPGPAGLRLEDLPTRPTPEMSAEQVVRIQLAALRLNDELDRGVAICFDFASPGNQAMTGPAERFARMLRQPPFSTLLNHQHVQWPEGRVEGDVAMQPVIVFDRNGRSVGFVFTLSRQTRGEHAGCWLTDGVRPFAVEPQPPPGPPVPQSPRRDMPV